jgi:hypothetical protein
MEKGREPRDLRGLLRWFQEEWEDDVPDRLHGQRPWSAPQRYRHSIGSQCECKRWYHAGGKVLCILCRAEGEPVPDARRGEPVAEGYQGPAYDQVPDSVGGSRLGTPTFADPFRTYIEESPFQLQYAERGGQEDMTPHYARPMQAALATIAGHDERSLYYQRAIFLYRLAWSGFQYRVVCAYLGLPEWTWEWVTEQALRLLWNRYQVAPDAMAA